MSDLAANATVTLRVPAPDEAAAERLESEPAHPRQRAAAGDRAERGSREPAGGNRRRRSSRRQERIGRRKRAALVLAVVGAAVLVVTLSVGFGAGAALSSGCDLNSLRPVEIGQNSFVFAANGSLLGTIPAEKNRQPVALSQMSPWLPKATVAIEDRRFYQHGGVDYEGIARAAWRDLTAGHVVEGGSTITQQLVAQPLHRSQRADDPAQAERGLPRDQALAPLEGLDPRRSTSTRSITATRPTGSRRRRRPTSRSPRSS